MCELGLISPSSSTASCTKVWVGGKNNSFWFATALEGATYIPKDGVPHGCGKARGKQKQSPLGSQCWEGVCINPLHPNQAASTKTNPDRHLLNLS